MPRKNSEFLTKKGGLVTALRINVTLLIYCYMGFTTVLLVVFFVVVHYFEVGIFDIITVVLCLFTV